MGHGKLKTKQRPTRKSSIKTIQLFYIIALFQCFFSMRTTGHCPTGQSTLFQVHCPIFINKNVRVGPRDLESFCVSQQQEDKAAACPFIHGKLWNYIFVLSLASLSPFFMDYRPLLLIVPILSSEDVDDDEFPRIPSCPPPTTIFCLHDLVHLQCRISIAGATAQELECIPTSCSSAVAPLDLVAAIRCVKIPHPIPSAGIVSNWAAIHRPGGIELR